MYRTALFTFDQPISSDTEQCVLQAAQTAEHPETVRAVLAASDRDIQSELDFIELSICGNTAAERAYAVFVEQLERPRGCEAVLAASGETSTEDRALLLDHYLVVTHRIAQGFNERVRKHSS
ncbi:MAG TPA: hypothetical protein VF370_01010 [Candidatus Cryosericum sp.]